MKVVKPDGQENVIDYDEKGSMRLILEVITIWATTFIYEILFALFALVQSTIISLSIFCFVHDSDPLQVPWSECRRVTASSEPALHTKRAELQILASS